MGKLRVKRAFARKLKLSKKSINYPRVDPIQEAERRVGADGTDEYFREIRGRNELSEPDYEGGD